MRKWRWEIAAASLHDIEPNLGWTIGVLGKLDHELYERDQRHIELARMGPSAKLSEWVNVLDAISLSYLWVLGAYEAVRTINQRLLHLGHAAANRKRASGDLKHQFERLRVPLAKLEPARRHSTTDYSFPRPGIDDDRGIAWEVAPGEALSRSRLSDDFLSFLERLRDGSLSG